jgi:hypothetical protein
MSAAPADCSVSDLCHAAAVEFVRQARAGEDPRRFRLDLKRRVEVPDRALTILGRQHSVRVRIKITCESMVFDRPEVGTASIVIPPQEA